MLSEIASVGDVPAPRVNISGSSAKWIAMSGVQKCIRRGDAGGAWDMAWNLLQIDPPRLFKRMNVIACEEVGVLNIPLLNELYDVGGKLRWMKDNGGLEFWAHRFVTEMANSPKDRTANELVVIACQPPNVPERIELGGYSDEVLSKIAGSSEEAWERRAMATWYLAGTFRVSNMLPRPGSMEKVIGAFGDVPIEVLDIAVKMKKRCYEAQPIFLPLAWLALHGSGYEMVEEEALPMEMCGLVPSMALDKHTQPGKMACAYFRKACPGLEELMESTGVGRQEQVEAVGMAIFRAEGEKLHKRATNAATDEIRRKAETAQMGEVGFSEDVGKVVLSLIYENMDVLHKARRRVYLG